MPAPRLIRNDPAASFEIVKVEPSGTKRLVSGQLTPLKVRSTRSLNGTIENRAVAEAHHAVAGHKGIALLAAARHHRLETRPRRQPQDQLHMGQSVVVAAAEAADQDRPGRAARQRLVDRQLAIGLRLVGGKALPWHRGVGGKQCIIG